MRVTNLTRVHVSGMGWLRVHSLGDLDYGGTERPPAEGQFPEDYYEMQKASECEVTVLHASQGEAGQLEAFRDGTVIYEHDTGERWVQQNARSMETPKLGQNGQLKVKFGGSKMFEEK